jgi:hypothetical protein
VIREGVEWLVAGMCSLMLWAVIVFSGRMIAYN